MTTRRQLLEIHNNNYGFMPQTIAEPHEYPGVFSVIIPYYNTGHIFERCVHFLNNAVAMLPGRVEIIVVDDGSEKLPARAFIDPANQNIKLIEHEANQGRTAARNTGLAHAAGDLILFLDSDVLVDDRLLNHHLSIHQKAISGKKKAIAISFFEFTHKQDARIEQDMLIESDIAINDFRIDCTYGETWIGCEEDKKFIGQHMRIVEETNYLRDWKGQYKAWMLPNMILGGAFSVRKAEISAVGNFDTRFSGYGFTETSAVTRMIAERNNVVIPVLIGGALHIEDELTNVPRGKKDEIFKQKHDFYFNTFLQEESK